MSINLAANHVDYNLTDPSTQEVGVLLSLSLGVDTYTVLRSAWTYETTPPLELADHRVDLVLHGGGGNDDTL